MQDTSVFFVNGPQCTRLQPFYLSKNINIIAKKMYASRNQGDQIGQIFAYSAIVYFGQFFCKLFQ
jgi:hypothetical protein